MLSYAKVKYYIYRYLQHRSYKLHVFYTNRGSKQWGAESFRDYLIFSRICEDSKKFIPTEGIRYNKLKELDRDIENFYKHLVEYYTIEGYVSVVDPDTKTLANISLLEQNDALGETLKQQEEQLKVRVLASL